ncbi:PQQ-dependent sugar dehydrogenase [Vulgatibacter sp.]|uniref:PQQ-dependent sugar dehydrogenase n=1 Tax=Vulgatibacter sp. TaxID=1971226 RepID=UPI0035698746
MSLHAVRQLLLLVPFLAAAGCKSSNASNSGQQRDLRLTIVASGFSQPTDLQFVPGAPDLLLVLQKEGTAAWVDLVSGRKGTILELQVSTASELGLLGLAFHPDFARNRKIYVNYTVRAQRGGNESRISEFVLPAGEPLGRARNERILLRQQQPYVNHNAGQLQFGPDGLLYVGFGDGGSAGDPQDNAQDPSTFLGKMLRIDVDGTEGEKPYAVPGDNPFVGREGWLPEIWALGLRNPWRYSFDPRGRLVVADVGQNAWEEIDLVQSGDNLGWDHREGFHCYEPQKACRSEGLVDPIYEYGHDVGQSITGGYVYTGSRIPALRGKYLFTDFASGRLWALELPKERQRVEKAQELGRTGRAVATLGRDARGEIYLADFSSGEILRLDGIP